MPPRWGATDKIAVLPNMQTLYTTDMPLLTSRQKLIASRYKAEPEELPALNFITLNGVSAWTGRRINSVIKTLPYGAYTYCRSVGYDGIFQLDLHIERLRKGVERLRRSPVESKEVEEAILPSLQVSLNEVKANMSFESDYLFLCHLSGNMEASVITDVLRHPTRPVQVFARPMTLTGRGQTSRWIVEKDLYSEGYSDYNDVLMVTPEGEILEGLETNFVVLHSDDSIQTAPLDLGIGHSPIRDLFFKLCEEKEITIIESSPHISEVDKWKGCAVLSSSRLSLPVENFVLHQNFIDFDFTQVSYPNPELLLDLEDEMHRKLQDESFSII